MNILLLLIPISIFLGAIGLLALYWSLKTNQYDDPKGDASRILNTEYDDHPKN